MTVSTPETTTTSPSPEALRERWEALLEDEPNTRIRDAAEELGVGEAQLLATQVGEGVVRLRPAFKELFEAFPGLGRVMASTRNDWAVIEKIGEYDNIDINPHVGLVLDEQIDLRLFMGQYHSAFAVEKPRPRQGDVLRSVQLFDKEGTSLHKVYVQTEEGAQAWRRLIEDFTHEDQSTHQPRELREAPDPETPDEDIDVEVFQADWRELQDTHDFFGMLREHGVARTQAMRLAPERYTTEVAVDSAGHVLHRASESGTSIMVFVPNPGCIEIHTGPVHKIVEARGWLNVFDEDFNLHLNQSGFDRAWVVRKPTEDGMVTSLELFDAEDRLIAMFFGERKPGIPEDEGWRELIEQLAEEVAV